jgi:AraC-like DNA-binding protein
MTLNGPPSLIDSKREAVASGDAVEGDTEGYRPPIDELLSSAREDVARLTHILRHLHCGAVLRAMDGDGAPRTHAELWAPIHGPDGQPIASLELWTGDIHCSDSLKKLLNALMQSFARAIAERWFRLSYRRFWVIAAVAQGEADTSMLLAIDREQRLVGADHWARQGLEAGGRSIQAPCTLSTFFQIHGVNVRAMRYRDGAMTLSGRADGNPWSVLITPPDLGADSDIDERAILHARPRLDSISCAGRPIRQGAYESGLPPGILRRVEEYIDAHLDSALGIQELAASVGISVSHFSRSFFRSVGLTPHSYIMRRRLTRAQDLLARTDLALAEVALTTGFSDQSHFCRRFREFIGLPPRSFRMQHR